MQTILLANNIIMDADVTPEFSPLKTVQFGNPSQDTVDPRDGGFGGRLWRWKWEKWIKAIYWGVNGSWIENQYTIEQIILINQIFSIC